jgi:energy-coupling factor transporter ATP-binding protein EcfA2
MTVDRIGPNARRQLMGIKATWQQSQHFMLSGPTGSGKSEISSHLCDMRADAGGHVVVCVLKPRDDETIINRYLNRGYVRWKTMPKHPSPWDNKVLLWPDVSKAKGVTKTILAIQRSVFAPAVARFIDEGKRTVDIDECLYWCHPQFLNMSQELAMMHSIGRSGSLTMIDNMQRPADLPLIIYGSASQVLIGRTREEEDLKRLRKLGTREGAKRLGEMIADQSKHDFTHVNIDADLPAEPFNLRH